jgi:hypothetical protein
MKDDTEEQRSAKIHAFWFIYMLDKNLSLRLGRASSIQDYDMSLPYPNASQSASHIIPMAPVRDTLVYWIKVAQIQGSTYEKLFSPAAFSKSEEERARICVDLVDQLDQAWGARKEVRQSAIPHTYTSSNISSLVETCISRTLW